MNKIHCLYYEQLDKNPPQIEVDIREIMSSLKSKVFQGCNLTFSGVIPLEQRADQSVVWRTALEFGSQCSHDIDYNVTHMVAARIGTKKVAIASKMPDVSVVKVNWFWESVHKWERQPEAKYLLVEKRDNSLSPRLEQRTADVNGISSYLPALNVEIDLLAEMNKAAEAELEEMFDSSSESDAQAAVSGKRKRTTESENENENETSTESEYLENQSESDEDSFVKELEEGLDD